MGKRQVQFRLGSGVGIGSGFVPSRVLQIIAAIRLIGLYIYYVTIKFRRSDADAGDGGGSLEPLVVAKRAGTPSYLMIGLQGAVRLVGLILGAHLFTTAAETISGPP